LPLQPSGSHCGGVRANKTVSVREASDATTKHLIGDIALKLDLDRQREHAALDALIGTDDDSHQNGSSSSGLWSSGSWNGSSASSAEPGAVRLNRDGGS